MSYRINRLGFESTKAGPYGSSSSGRPARSDFAGRPNPTLRVVQRVVQSIYWTTVLKKSFSRPTGRPCRGRSSSIASHGGSWRSAGSPRWPLVTTYRRTAITHRPRNCFSIPRASTLRKAFRRRRSSAPSPYRCTHIMLLPAGHACPWALGGSARRKDIVLECQETQDFDSLTQARGIRPTT